MLITKSTLVIALTIVAVPGLTLSQTVSSQTAAQDTAAQEVLKAEREQREAYLQRDIAKTERLVADEFILTNGRDIGSKKTLIGFLISSEPDPTLSLTSEDTRVTVNGDTAIVIGRRVERRRREDNNREGVAYARYVRTYIKRQEHWQTARRIFRDDSR